MKAKAGTPGVVLRNLSIVRRAALALEFCFLLTPLILFSSDSQPNGPNPYNVQFVDGSKKSGIHFHHERAASAEKLYVETMGSGVAWLDYNQDGLMDALFVNSGFTPLFQSGPEPQPALYRNNGDGTFTDVTMACSRQISDGVTELVEDVGHRLHLAFPLYNFR